MSPEHLCDSCEHWDRCRKDHPPHGRIRVVTSVESASVVESDDRVTWCTGYVKAEWSDEYNEEEGKGQDGL